MINVHTDTMDCGDPDVSAIPPRMSRAGYEWPPGVNVYWPLRVSIRMDVDEARQLAAALLAAADDADALTLVDESEPAA